MTLSASEESILATVFGLAWETAETVTWSSSNSHFATTAILRIGYRLIQLGFKTGWHSGEMTSIRSHSPTPLAWDWAANNASRISSILNPPFPVQFAT